MGKGRGAARAGAARGARIAAGIAALVGAGGGRSHADPPAQESTDAQPYALTISGGVSLGAYEAGVNWALLEVLRSAPPTANFGRPYLAGVTGASAGSINALLTVMHWCDASPRGLAASPDIADPEQNRFATTWLPIGLTTLVPRARDYDDAARHMPDALLSRTAFRDVRGDIQAAVGQARFRPGCSLSLGLTVTRIVPSRVQTAGLSVENQRFVVPLRASVSPDGRLHFWNDVRPHRAELVGSRIFLANPEDRDSHPSVSELSIETVIDAVLASSAFPVAFGPVRLDYFSEREDCATRRVRRRAGFTRCSDWFVDGGVFDNIPLGLAIAQIESHVLFAATSRPVRYLYIDADSRRRRAVQEDAEPPGRETHCAKQPNGDPISRALRCWRSTFTGAVGTARGYELHNVLRYNAWNRGTTWVAREAADRLVARARPRPGEAIAGRSALRRCAGADLDALAAPIGEAPHVPVSSITVCYQRADATLRRRYLGAIAERLQAWSRELDRLRLDGSTRRAEHERVRGAILRLVPALPEMVGHTSAIGAAVTLDRLAAEALLLATDPGAERVLYPSRRFFPLAATYVANFSGFLDPPLRRHDYYVGIHDAIHSSASAICEQEAAGLLDRARPSLEQPAMQGCLDRWTADLRRRLGLDRGTAGAFLARLDVIERAYWRGAAREPIPRSDDLHRILRALTSGRDGALLLEDTDLAGFVAALKREGYRPVTAEMAAAMRDPELWWTSLSVSLLARQRKLDVSGLTTGVMFFGERVMASLEDAHDEGLLVQPASIPAHAPLGWHWLRLLPEILATSASQERALDAAWQVGVGWRGLRASLEPRFWIGYGEPALDLGIDLGYRSRGLTSHVLVSSVGVSPAYTALGDNQGHVRVEIYLSTLSNKVRFALGTNSLTRRDDLPVGELLYGTVGFADLPGLAYSALHRLSWMFD